MASKSAVAHAAFQAVMAAREEASAKPNPVWLNRHPPKPTPLMKLRAAAALNAALKVQPTATNPMGPPQVNPLADSPNLNSQGLLAMIMQKQKDPLGLT